LGLAILIFRLLYKVKEKKEVMWRSCPSVSPSARFRPFVQAAKLLVVGLLYKELWRGSSFVKLISVAVRSTEGGK
jgi:hypothetical protein